MNASPVAFYLLGFGGYICVGVAELVDVAKLHDYLQSDCCSILVWYESDESTEKIGLMFGDRSVQEPGNILYPDSSQMC